MSPFDPVCGMQIDKWEAAGTAEYGGETYPFCSQACRELFLRDPEAFVRGPPEAGTAESHRDS